MKNIKKTPSGQSKNYSKKWATPVFCSLITALGAAYTTYTDYKTKSYIEELKTKNEQEVAKVKADTEIQIAKIKSDTESKINQAELLSKTNILLLTSQIETNKEQRAKAAANELAEKALRAQKCAEVKYIIEAMSRNIVHIRYNDINYDEALSTLTEAKNKTSLYFSKYAIEKMTSLIPKKPPENRLEKLSTYYSAMLEGYTAEFRENCSK
ncbi:hypothetical protein NLK61_25390 [Pseudomonas fuscovaginae UPB0736]|uniref:hypothetical protein n=1 Tax=Pseudomonas asplenii TaxID=53407 RepID=UPI0002892315|nr:hypothetical protein [Pseudomonas fuscovaginae]UUQ64504.1 hypothetical protein NLK61_25390 [Pseudomonas fuscovaginae UPB0736]